LAGWPLAARELSLSLAGRPSPPCLQVAGTSAAYILILQLRGCRGEASPVQTLPADKFCNSMARSGRPSRLRQHGCWAATAAQVVLPLLAWSFWERQTIRA